MRNLYLRIFSVLILTVAFSFAIGFMISPWLRPFEKDKKGPTPFHPRSGHKPGMPRFDGDHGPPKEMDLRHDLVSEISWIMDMGKSVLETEGLDSFLQTLDLQNESQFMEFFILTPDGQSLGEKEVPAEILQMLKSEPAQDTPLFGETGNRLIYYRLVKEREDSAPLVYVGAFFRHPPPLHRNFWRGPILYPPLTMLLCLAVACYIIARYISRPATILRETVRAFADGNLDVRVGPALQKRKDELGELAREFDHMADQITALIGAQRRLLEDVSHELRSPLARQTIAIELLRQKLGPDAQNDLDRVEREASRLEVLIAELLSLSRLESDAEPVIPSPVNIESLVTSIVHDADFEARSHNRSVVLCESFPFTISGSAELLHRAVENIIRNAIHHTAENTTVDVTMTPGESSGGCTMTIRDHGPGIPEDTLEDIFKPFYRVQKSRDRQTGGAGLGLAIAQRAILKHGGTICARNLEEGGLEITITFPGSYQFDRGHV